MRKLSAIHWFWIILLVGIGVRIPLIVKSGQLDVLHERTEEVLIAHTLAERNEFADPYKIPTGLTAHSPPFGPFLNSLYWRAFGFTRRAEVVKEAVCTIVGCMVWALFPWAAIQFELRPYIGVAAGLFCAVIPLHLYYETKGEWEAVWIALSLLLLTVLFARTWGRTGFAIWRGLAVGAVLYIQPGVLPVIVFWLIAEILLNPSKVRVQLAKQAAICVVLIACLQVPWAYRNYRALGSVVWPRSNLGLEMWLAYNDLSQPTLDEGSESGAIEKQHPIGSLSEALEVRREGEVVYNRKKSALVKEWISAHPAKAFQLTASRVRHYWLPDVDVPSKYMLLWFITLCGWMGLCVLWRLNRAAAWLILILWVSYPIVAYIVPVSTRLAFPIFWSQALLTAVLLADLRWPIRS